jgi:hypothetical protein
MSYRGKVGLGITTYKRPELFRECRDSVLAHLGDLVDEVLVFQDGGESYVWNAPRGWHVHDDWENRGWAVAKNYCLNVLSAIGCEHLFMIEDDTLVTSPAAITGYVDAALSSGLHYLTAHPWGEATTRVVEVAGDVTYWAYVGSWWTYMSIHGYRTGGGYNETFGGVMGDIELPQRWKRLGLTSGWGRLPDATGSEEWVKPRCLTIAESTIANEPGWVEHQAEVLAWWMANMPETVPCEIRPAREKSGNCLRA